MSHRLLRAAVLLLAIAAVGGLGYRYYEVDREAAALDADAHAAIGETERPAADIAQLRIALVSMIAPGQNVASWSQQVTARIASLRTEAGRLPADGGVQPPGTVSAALDKIANAERRARTQAMEGQQLLASDIVFSEATPLLEGLVEAFATTGATRDEAAAQAIARLARQRQLFAAGAAGVGLLAALLLLPLPRRAGSRASTATEPIADRPEPAAAVPTVPSPAPPLPAPAAVAAAPPPAPGIPVGELARTASVCADLARVTEGPQLASALARVGNLLGATGVTVWVADLEGRQLTAAAWYGYDQSVFELLGPIPRDAANLVAAAYRGPATRTSPAVTGAKAAVAVPVPGAGGPVGVLSAELAEGVTTVPSTTAALAAIVAAQLATLVGPRPADDLGTSIEGSAHQQARG